MFPSGVLIIAATSLPRAWIEDRDGRVVEERADPRASFAGHVLATPWDRLHLLYFAGYANWNYFTAPFLLTEPTGPLNSGPTAILLLISDIAPSEGLQSSFKPATNI